MDAEVDVPWNPAVSRNPAATYVGMVGNRPMNVDTTAWSGDGDFTTRLLEALGEFDEITSLKVEDAPASRAGAGFNFLVNEIFVTFATAARREPSRWLGLVPWTRRVEAPVLALSGLEARLAQRDNIGPADYADDGMLQYLRTERVLAPYQARGYKLVEMVRVYEARRPG